MQKVALSELPSLVHRLLASLSPHERATVVALTGELGAGKTTFTQALAKELGVEDTVQSPTYVLMKKYKISHPHFSALVHIDAYRLEKPEEFLALKPEEFLNDPHNLVVVEWPERLGNLLPNPHLAVSFSADGALSQERYIELTNG
jgi:tRNA threonylcarbamoyladenosine biosynthesis protein TsaE